MASDPDNSNQIESDSESTDPAANTSQLAKDSTDSPKSTDSPSSDPDPAVEDGWVGRTVSKIADIGADVWDSCNRSNHPFTSYAFFSSLEDGETLGAKTGWAVQYLLLSRQSDGFVGGILPLFIKGHSYGEYVFDHSWAQAFEAAGGRYYPKLLTAVPFTPATGPRFLIHPHIDFATGRALLARLGKVFCDQQSLSSFHLNFLLPDDANALEKEGFLIRNDQQFHWYNQSFEDFDGFLETLSSRKRKTIRRERRGALEGGITIHALRGDDIGPEHWDAFFRFYLDTGSRKWGQPYLTRAFFDHLGTRMSDKLLLIMAQLDGDWVAGALNIIDEDCLYGRYWGADREFPFLHFEVCYYRAIDFAIEHGLSRVEAGAQGQHKIARGYQPSKTYSAHHISNPGFREAVDHYLRRERIEVDNDIAYLQEFAPFKKG